MTPMDPHELRSLLQQVDAPDPRDILPSAMAKGRALRRRRRTLNTALTAGVVVAVVAWAVVATQSLAPSAPSPTASPSPISTAATPSPEPTAGDSTPVDPRSPEPSGESSVDPSPAPATTPPQTPTPTHTPADAARVDRPVYFLTETPAGPKLVRESRKVLAQTPARSAVEAMLRPPLDPDYFSPWPSGVEVLGIAPSDGIVTIDLSGEALRPNVGAAYEEAMFQQLVWTLTGVLDVGADVQVHVDGRSVESLAGHVDWSQPRGRADFDEAGLNSLWIDAPMEGAELVSPVTVTGEATAFEANVPYTLFDAEGGIVSQGATLAREGQARSPWSLTLELGPGSYLLEVREDDPSDGEGGPVDVDTRAFTVVEVPGS